MQKPTTFADLKLFFSFPL